MNIQEKKNIVNNFDYKDAISLYGESEWNQKEIHKIVQGFQKSGGQYCSGHCASCRFNCPKHMMENPENAKSSSNHRRTKDEIYPGMRTALRCGVLPPKLLKTTVEYLDNVPIMSMLYDDGRLVHFKANAWGTEAYCAKAESLIKDAVKAAQEKFKYCVLATMTYDTKRQNEDIIESWNDFISRIGRLLKNAWKVHRLQYVAVREPTARGYPHIHVLFFSQKPLFRNHDNMKGGHEIHHGRFYKWLKEQNKNDIVNLKVLKGNGVGNYVAKYITKGLAGKCRELVKKEKKYSKEEMKTLLDFIIFPVVGKRKFTMSQRVRAYAIERKASFRDDERDLCQSLERASELHSLSAASVRRLSVDGLERSSRAMFDKIARDEKRESARKRAEGNFSAYHNITISDEGKLRHGIKLQGLHERNGLLFEVYDAIRRDDGSGDFLKDWSYADTPRKRRVLLIKYCINLPLKCGKRVFMSNPKSIFRAERWQEMVQKQDYKPLEDWLRDNTDTITCGGCFLSHFSNWIMNGADVYFSRLEDEYIDNPHKPYCGFSLWDLDDESFEAWVNYSLRWRLEKLAKKGQTFESIHDFMTENYFGKGQFRRTLQNFEMSA